MRKPITAIFGATIAALTAYALYDAFWGPQPEVLGYGQVEAKSRYDANRIERPRTREMRRGDVRYREVELPGGAWIACEKDCAETYRRRHMDLYETIHDEAG
jgi:hypothetical protein